MAKFPPQGYKALEYPLPHNFDYKFSLHAEGSDKHATYATLLKATEQATGVDSVIVNPKNAAFAEDVGALIHMGSIVPRISVSINAFLTKTAIETDAVRQVMFNWMPIYTAFLPSLEAQDDKTDTQIEDILELQHNPTDKDAYPLFDGTKLSHVGSQPLSTIGRTEVFGDYGLATNATMENIAFDKELYYDAKSYYTNSAMLNKVAPKMHSALVTRDRPFHHFSNNFTHPTVKRGNPYTYCGILFYLPNVDKDEQLIADAADVTNTSPILHVNMKVRYDEWNPMFDQSPL